MKAFSIFGRKETPSAPVAIAEITTGPHNDSSKEFGEGYQSVERTLEFDPRWNNGTGYFDPAVRLVRLAPGERARSRCPETKRRVVFLGTVLGTAVVFERNPRGAGGVVCNNLPYAIARLNLRGAESGSMDGFDVWAALHPTNGLAHRLQRMKEIFEGAYQEEDA